MSGTKNSSSGAASNSPSRSSRRPSSKLWVIVSAAVIGGMALGVAFGAASLSNQPVNSYANAYSTTFNGVTAFQGASATNPPGIAVAFSSHSGCTSGPVALGATLSEIYVGVTPATLCTAGDFGFEYTIYTNTTASGSLSSPHSVTFNFQSTYGAGPTISVNTITVTTSSTTAPDSAQLIFVDFGTAWLPAGGVSGFNVIAVQTS